MSRPNPILSTRIFDHFEPPWRSLGAKAAVSGSITLGTDPRDLTEPLPPST
jgi:hypothetical protein